VHFFFRFLGQNFEYISRSSGACYIPHLNYSLDFITVAIFSEENVLWICSLCSRDTCRLMHVGHVLKYFEHMCTGGSRRLKWFVWYAACELWLARGFADTVAQQLYWFAKLRCALEDSCTAVSKATDIAASLSPFYISSSTLSWRPQLSSHYDYIY
jgi:hypothetical protein